MREGHHPISRSEFLASKKSDAVTIWGCGWSVNQLSHTEIQQLTSHDGWGFNWFCFSGIPVTHYLIREQTSHGQNGRENRAELTSILGRQYLATNVVIANLATSTGEWSNGFNWANNRTILRNGVIVANELNGKRMWGIEHADRTGQFCEHASKYNPFTNGLLYDFCTMTSVLHMVAFMRYSKVVFAGVDLYDHRYFWLKEQELRYTTQTRKRTLDQRHHVANYTIRLVKSFRDRFPHVKLSVVNPKSLLTEVIPVWQPST